METVRRRVDWKIILDPDAPVPAATSRPARGDLASLLSAFDELAEIDDSDAIVRRAVELARERIGLERAGVFLLDEPRNLMLGTWGTDAEGASVDEHHLMYEMGDNDREVFRRSAVEGAHFTVFENCPLVVQREAETVVVGRGWVACTPIRSAHKRVGMLFNDTALTGAPVDEGKQARAALLCSLLGALLDADRGRSGLRAPASTPPAQHPLVLRATRLLADDPSLGGKEIAARLDISLSRLARVFKSSTGVSLVDYRNQLRLARFRVLVDAGGENLLAAALAAGFGSYAQFHRVFRAFRGTTPRDYVRRRSS
jgi:AraC-like DNA-binding protein